MKSVKKCCTFSWQRVVGAIALVIIIVSCLCIWKMSHGWMGKQRGIKMMFNSGYNQQAQKDVLIKNEVQAAVSMLQVLADKTTTGELTMTAAQKLGADLLRAMRYDNGEGYFWADTKEGVNVVLYGDKAVEGTNRYENQANGVYYVKEIIKAGMQNGGGYANYSYHKQNETENKSKRSYSLYFTPFNWVVGTGYYLEDVISNRNTVWGGKEQGSCGMQRGDGKCPCGR